MRVEMNKTAGENGTFPCCNDKEEVEKTVMVKTDEKPKEFPDSVVSKECVRNLIENVCGSIEYVKFTQRFYDDCVINCRRWAKLLRGELSITVDELKRLCKTLNVAFTAETFERQLKLFDK